MADVNDDFHVYQLAEMPVLSALHRDLPEDEMMANMTIVPPELHSSISYFEPGGQKLTLMYHGGIMPESFARTNSCHKIYKTSFFIENQALAMESTDTQSCVAGYHSTEPHLKQQKGPKKYLMEGSKLVQLAGSSMVKYQNNLVIFHGFSSEQDENVDDIYIVKNLINENETQRPEVILCPGKSKMNYVIGDQQRKISDYSYRQRGDIPGARSGHHCFVVNGEVLLIGGHLLVEQQLDPGKVMSMEDHPVYSFNPDTVEWKTVNLRPNNTLLHLLNRSNFGAVQRGNEIWITGGVLFDRGEMRTLPINQLICLNTSDMKVTVIQLRGLEEQINIQNFSLTARPDTSELYIFGGDLQNKNPQTSNGLEKNKSVFKVDIAQETLYKISLPANEEKLIGISGNSAAWFNDRIAVIFGGSEPEAPNGGRRILLYTNITDVPDNLCAAAENCKILENLQQSHTRTIACDKCKAEYHWCCSSVSHLRRMPKNYSCVNCVSKSKKKK